MVHPFGAKETSEASAGKVRAPSEEGSWRARGGPWGTEHRRGDAKDGVGSVGGETQRQKIPVNSDLNPGRDRDLL